MQTEQLIAKLQAEAAENPPPRALRWPLAALGAVLAAGLALLGTIGVRPDFMQAIETVRFDFKFLLTAILAGATLLVLRELARPTGDKRKLIFLVLPVLLLVGSVLVELAMVPQALWETRMMGTNSMACLITIPLFGLVPLGLFLYTSAERAPLRPRLQGALCGLAAAAISAFFYAAHCIDDSPLFVATWYPSASAILVAAGALIGQRLLRW
ncbi:NrsF family protein [Fulvimarina sp. MAC3]|uniref:NrsF family protein n=1 Tax=Fulvimarina sp. MAC3 TaxID=3148887 RepID=UPI0031FE0686